MTLGQKLRSLREGKALTQDQLVFELGKTISISQGKLSGIENGKTPSFIEICKICEYFGITPNQMWDEIKNDISYRGVTISYKGHRKKEDRGGEKRVEGK